MRAAVLVESLASKYPTIQLQARRPVHGGIVTLSNEATVPTLLLDLDSAEVRATPHTPD